MKKTPSLSERILTNWQRLHDKPGGKWIFSRLVGWIIPYTGTMRAVVKELRPGFARVDLADRRRVRNHLRSLHAIAIANLGEFTTGLAVFSGLPPGMRGILRGLEVSYEKKARGTITGVCQSPRFSPHQNMDAKVTAELFNAAGERVAVVTATWVVGPEKPLPRVKPVEAMA